MKEIIYCLLAGFFLWVLLVIMVNRFTNPEKTETQLLLDIPRSIILDFD